MKICLGSTAYEHLGENNKTYGQSTTVFSITERKNSIQQILLWCERRREPQRERVLLSKGRRTGQNRAKKKAI